VNSFSPFVVFNIKKMQKLEMYFVLLILSKKPITAVIGISNLQTPYNISQAEFDIVVLWSNPFLAT
jgi:hypothetical protein